MDEKLNEALDKAVEIISEELTRWMPNTDTDLQRLDKLTELLDRMAWAKKHLKEKKDD